MLCPLRWAGLTVAPRQWGTVKWGSTQEPDGPLTQFNLSTGLAQSLGLGCQVERVDWSRKEKQVTADTVSIWVHPPGAITNMSGDLVHG
jgi:hypothetical protein